MICDPLLLCCCHALGRAKETMDFTSRVLPHVAASCNHVVHLAFWIIYPKIIQACKGKLIVVQD